MKLCLNTVLNHLQELLLLNFLLLVRFSTSRLVSREFFPRFPEILLLVCDLRAASNVRLSLGLNPTIRLLVRNLRATSNISPRLNSASITLSNATYKNIPNIYIFQVTNPYFPNRQQQYFEQPQGQHPQMQQTSPQGIPQQPQVVYMQQSPGVPGQPGHPQSIPMQQTSPGAQPGVAGHPQQQAPGGAGAGAQRTYQNVTPLASLGRSPAPVDCPACGQRQMTRISFLAGNYTQYVFFFSFRESGERSFGMVLIYLIVDGLLDFAA